MQQFPCPACQKMISAVVAPGTMVQCPLCQQPVQVPGAAGAPVAPPTAMPGGMPSYIPPAPKKTSWAPLLIVLLVVGVLVIGLLVSILLPSLSRARELSKRTVCAANLRGIGQAMYIYAQSEPDGAFPDDIQKVLSSGFTTPKQFVCPSSLGGIQSYYYVPGQTTNSAPNGVLLFEDPANHNGEGGNVLYQDGHVQFIKGQQFQSIVDTYVDIAQ